MRNKQILLVDDEPSIRIVLSAVLEQSGYSVETAEDGYVALRKIQLSKPDLVITDLRMPNMNGFELLSVIRSRYPDLPTIAISGEFLAVDAHEGPLADAFFQKGNYALPDFLDRIAALLSSPPQRKTHPQAPVWAPTGDQPVMLTCTACLHSFPIDLCDGSIAQRKTNCIVCGDLLDIQLAAVGVAQSSKL